MHWLDFKPGAGWCMLVSFVCEVSSCVSMFVFVYLCVYLCVCSPSKLLVAGDMISS